MSGGAKFIIGLIVVALILFGAWYWLKSSMTETTDNTANQTTATSTEETAQTPPPQQNLITSNDTSDASLAADLSAIDGQMTLVGQDSAQVDSSLSDKSAQ